MLLAIDIGNSATKFGLFAGARLASKFAIESVSHQTSDEIYAAIEPNLKNEFSDVIISSVVAELELPFSQLFENYFNLIPIFVDHTFDYGFSIKYFPPESCGADRLINAYAASGKYGKPCIVCSFGTATTIDVVNSRDEYLGGVIAPGMKSLAASLFEKTSKLPKVEIAKPEKVIGNTTVDSIQSGIYFGYLSLVDGVISQMIAELDEIPKIIATGGFSGLIGKNSKFIEVVEENLTLVGLQMIYQKTLEMSLRDS